MIILENGVEREASPEESKRFEEKRLNSQRRAQEKESKGQLKRSVVEKLIALGLSIEEAKHVCG